MKTCRQLQQSYTLKNILLSAYYSQEKKIKIKKNIFSSNKFVILLKTKQICMRFSK